MRLGKFFTSSHAERVRHSVATCCSRESAEKSAPNPPVVMMTGPCSENVSPPFTYLQPTTAPFSVPILTLSIAAAIWLRIFKDASGRVIASVVQGTDIAIITGLEVMLALAVGGIARVDGACHAVVAVHRVHVDHAGAGVRVTDVLAVALVAVLASLGGVNAHAV